MGNCPACHGVICLECFNPEECMEITRQQAEMCRNLPDIGQIIRQRNELAKMLAYFLERYESEHGWDGETDVPNEVRDARAALGELNNDL